MRYLEKSIIKYIIITIKKLYLMFLKQVSVYAQNKYAIHYTRDVQKSLTFKKHRCFDIRCFNVSSMSHFRWLC